MDTKTTNGRTVRVAPGRWRNLLAMFGHLLLLSVLGSSSAAAQLSIFDWHTFGFVAESARFGEAVAAGDFNGDGIDDFAVGQPLFDVGGMINTGAVHLYLSNGALLVLDTITSCAGANDNGTGYRLGAALAVGYFNDDAFADLAIGAPGAEVNGVSNAGSVCVVYGAADLPFARARFDQLPLSDIGEAGDEFGAALAAGDLDGNGIDDLVVGVPGENVSFGGGQVADAGAISVILGVNSGLTVVGNLFIDQGQLGFTSNDPEQGDRFGAAVAVGDLWNSDLYPELEVAVGAPGDLGSGSVVVLGSQTGLLAQRGLIYDGLSGWDLLGTPQVGDDFGAALAVGDFNGDGLDDLAVGAPGDDDLALAVDAGMVMVIYADALFLDTAGETALYEFAVDGGSAAGVEGFDRFGSSLAAGDFDADGFADLAVGAPLDNSLGVANSGEVTVLYGAPAGVQLDSHQIFNMFFFSGIQIGDEFGWSLASGRRQASGADSLLVGAPGRFEQVGGDEIWPDTGRATWIGSPTLFKSGFEDGGLDRWQ